jgi:hypothetical protein
MNIEDYPKYEKTTPHQKKEMAKCFARYLTGLVDLFKADSKNISYCEETLFDIIELVWKRKIYFQVFHNVNGLNELKEASLYCFWVLKLQPFLWLTTDKQNYQLNARIALWIFTNGLHFYATQKGKKINLSNDAIQNMYYSFRYRDWSKEALMDSAESLVS